ncbi:extradiol ring-cleavage dioxygenase [Brevibacillus sp. NRS-1366]|uniref:DODA-type extradiol aromatic ring-opening family dioxygenase n=1 Tax=Brevibacillus sp. NRS-1366 TaxID=3233899 RepID=UPI003D1E2A36
MSLSLGVLAAHVPSICHETDVPDFQQPLVKALYQVKAEIDQLQPDVIVLMSCHFPATFHHYVNSAPVHKGLLTAVECPDLIADVAYNYPGDAELANQLVQAGKNAGVPAIAFNEPTYMWDYGTLVPLRYLVPQANIQIIDLSVCWASSLEESYLWGQQIAKVLQESDKRAVFVSSGALSHNLVRGRHNMPTLSEQAMDNQFIDYIVSGEYGLARQMLTQYARIAGVESGGRHLASLLGVLGDQFKATYLGYAQSSGSGNAVFTFRPK